MARTLAERQLLGHSAFLGVEDFLKGTGGEKPVWAFERALSVFADIVRFSDLSEPRLPSHLEHLALLLENYARRHGDLQGEVYFRDQKEVWKKLSDLLSSKTRLYNI